MDPDTPPDASRADRSVGREAASPLPWGELLQTAREAADAAAEVHRRWAGRSREAGIRDKGHSDFVSQADLESQEAALAVIRSRHPDHGILAEEDEGEGEEDEGEGEDARGDGSAGVSDAPAGESGSRVLWVVDPLDGTTNFIHGHPAWCASVGVMIDGRPMVGAVTAAATGERWWGAPEVGAFRNGERIRVSGTESLRDALVGTGFPFKRLEELPEFLEHFGRVLPACSGIRRGGSAALDLCYLAQGSLDAFWEGRLAPWDIAGGLAILSHAGGCWSALDGRPLAVERGGSVLAANGPVLRDALRHRLEGR